MSWFSDSFKAFLRKGDLVLLGLCLAANSFGLLLVFSATRYLSTNANPNRSIIIQSICMLLGVLVYIAMSSVDVELFTEKSWKFLLIFNVLFNLAVRVPGLGVDNGSGNLSWIHIPGFPMDIQPAEIVKLTFIFLLAYQCAKLQEPDISRPSSVFSIAGHTLLMVGIIAVASGDFGMALIYFFIFVVVAWSAGIKKRWFLLAFVLAALAIGGVVALLILKPELQEIYFIRRVKVVIDHLTGNQETLLEQTQGIGMQQTRSILAIGSGGLTGMGFLQGLQTQSSSNWALNARSTDEIFAVCGEEFGLIGCLVLLALLAGIILRCIWVARRACSIQSGLLVMGVAGMLLAQVCINVAMCLYIFPVVGITLPFVSYGGSSLITMYASVGVVSSVKMRSLPSWLRDRSNL
ncbi:FtsW/RodA/SpoVE family cell cycle protein [Pseudoflavonifractor phocaeensis]|nr:FtsW/RodA/SpoVE family cell cycle protein [Pseudoflavonifractor phocaeensis]MBM6937217.1 FtsW/RodA/SpoVE family cell cycle protein [Pseudoflavonifractor phocaeensis]